MNVEIVAEAEQFPEKEYYSFLAFPESAHGYVKDKRKYKPIEDVHCSTHYT
jgi:hypothetical protein